MNVKYRLLILCNDYEEAKKFSDRAVNHLSKMDEPMQCRLHNGQILTKSGLLIDFSGPNNCLEGRKFDLYCDYYINDSAEHVLPSYVIGKRAYSCHLQNVIMQALYEMYRKEEENVKLLKRTVNSIYGVSNIKEKPVVCDEVHDKSQNDTEAKPERKLVWTHNVIPVNLKIKKVIYNYPATIVFWNDDTKTVVKAQGDDVYDPEKGLAMAICKKTMGNNTRDYYKIFLKHLPKEEETGLDYVSKVFQALAIAAKEGLDNDK